MAELGWFAGQRTELIGGEVLTVTPQRFAHYAAIEKTADALHAAFGQGVWIRTQAPLALEGSSEPEPDISVVAGGRDQYRDHPTTALLVVEVSDSSLAFDRRQKMGLYARSGIGEYWIINLVDRVLEVHRDPAPDVGQPFGFTYRRIERLGPEQAVSPCVAPDRRIEVAAILP